MRRPVHITAHITIWLAVIALGFALSGTAPALDPGRGPAPNRVSFEVLNPAEHGAQRTVVGNRYDPPCAASTVVLLQHGLSYHKEAWDFAAGYSVARPLAEAGYAVVAIDRLGYGESGLGNGYDVTFEAYADMSDQIVAALRAEFDHVVMGGHSAGAGVTEYAQGIHGSADAIMALGWHHRPSDQLAFEFMTGDTTRALEDDYEYFWGTPEHRAEMFYEPDADPDVVAADTEAANLVPSGEILSISKQPSRYAVARVDVPVFLQFGERDRLFEPEYAEFHASEFVSSPSVTVDMVPGAGHTFSLAPQGPAGTARMVDWLRSRPEAPACS